MRRVEEGWWGTRCRISLPTLIDRCVVEDSEWVFMVYNVVSFLTLVAVFFLYSRSFCFYH